MKTQYNDKHRKSRSRKFPAMWGLITSIILGNVFYYFARMELEPFKQSVHENHQTQEQAISLATWYVLYFGSVAIAAICIAIIISRAVRFIFAKIARTTAELGPTVVDAGTKASKQLGKRVSEVVLNLDERKQRSAPSEEAYAEAAEEIESGRVQKGLWAKAFADADGNSERQKALYLKYRAEQIRQASTKQPFKSPWAQPD